MYIEQKEIFRRNDWIPRQFFYTRLVSDSYTEIVDEEMVNTFILLSKN